MSFFGRWKSEAGKTECEINKKLHTGYRGSALQAQSPKIPFFEGSSVHRRKRAFLSVSRGPRAVMTAEAALVLPLFLFAFVTLLIPMRILDTERQVLAAAEAAAEEISRSGYFLLENPDGRETLSEAAAFVYAEAAIRTRLKDADLDGLSLAGSRLLSDGETVDLKVTYRHRFPFPVLRMQSVQRTVRCVRRAWIGMEDGAAEGVRNAASGAGPDGICGERRHPLSRKQDLSLSVQRSDRGAAGADRAAPERRWKPVCALFPVRKRSGKHGLYPAFRQPLPQQPGLYGNPGLCPCRAEIPGTASGGLLLLRTGGIELCAGGGLQC